MGRKFLRQILVGDFHNIILEATKQMDELQHISSAGKLIPTLAVGGGSEATFAHHGFLEPLGIRGTTENGDESRL